MCPRQAELDTIFQKLLVGAVPPAWLTAYPSLKPLAAWSRDLITRWQQLMDWAEHGPPKVFWLAGFTYPTGFLTALMQARPPTYCRLPALRLSSLRLCLVRRSALRLCCRQLY